MHPLLRDRRLPLVAAHRGTTVAAPENTLAGFRAALARGARALETDIQLSADGAVVVIHDARLDRTTNGTGWVKDHSLAALRTLDAGGWFSDQFRGVQVPLFDEVLALARGAAFLNIELKHGPIFYPDLEERAITAVRAAGMTEQVLFMSFDHQAVARAKRLAPEIPALIISGARLYDPVAYVRTVGADGINQSWAWWTPDLIETFHAASLIVHASLINEPAVWSLVADRRFDMFDTDNFDLL